MIVENFDANDATKSYYKVILPSKNLAEAKLDSTISRFMIELTADNSINYREYDDLFQNARHIGIWFADKKMFDICQINIREAISLYSYSYKTLVENMQTLKNLLLFEASSLHLHKGVFESNSLEIIKFNGSKEKNLLPFHQLKSLKQMIFVDRTIETFEGIEELTALEYMEFGACAKLRTLDHLANSRSLKALYIQSNAKIASTFEFLMDMPSLKALVLLDVGEIPTLKFLREHPSLELISVIGKTKILDGKISCLLDNPKIKSLDFQDKKGYDLINEQVPESKKFHQSKNIIIQYSRRAVELCGGNLAEFDAQLV